MKIELYIDGEKKKFTAPFVPMMAKRKYLEMLAKAEKRDKEITHEDVIEEEDDIYSILVDIIFKNQFTLDELYNGNTGDYIQSKLSEAIFGKKTVEDKEDEEGEQGK